MNKKCIVFLFSLLFSTFLNYSNALEVALSKGSDNRIRSIKYNSDSVVLLKTKVGVAIRVVFNKDEKIIDKVSGFTKGWEFYDVDNLLYIKAKSIKTMVDNQSISIAPSNRDWQTNLMVRTNKRLYDFDLKLITNRKELNDIDYRVEFVYENESKKEKLSSLINELKNEPDNANQNINVIPVNTDFWLEVTDNSESIKPLMVYDDGKFTYFKFSDYSSIPSFFIGYLEDETIANSHIVDKNTVAVHSISAIITLRLNDKLIGVYNNGIEDKISNETEKQTNTNINGLKRYDY